MRPSFRTVVLIAPALLAACGGGAAATKPAPSSPSTPAATAPTTAPGAAGEKGDNFTCDSARDCEVRGALAVRSTNAAPDGRKMLEKACTLGSDNGCLNLGLAHFNGWGGDVDRTRALTLLEGTCKKGVGRACDALGDVFVEDDLPRARQFFEQGCTAKDKSKSACASLGLMLAKGDGGEKDERRAASLSDQACKDREVLGCVTFGFLARDGLGMTANAEAALAAFERGCGLGNKTACKAKERMESDAASASSPSAKSAKSDVPGANLTMGSMKVDGTELKDIACKTDGLAGMLGGLAVGAGFKSRKGQLDACSPKALVETRVVWKTSGNRMADVHATAKDAATGRCVERALTGAVSTMPGMCGATVVHGKR